MKPYLGQIVWIHSRSYRPEPAMVVEVASETQVMLVIFRPEGAAPGYGTLWERGTEHGQWDFIPAEVTNP